ncbi:MAG: hypothetical protein PHP13_07175 [Methanomicrobium sp.]|nr:hypothetical protein [Methanomicrobium sp.]MDD4299596.1 hypothetical protein [Methanomicrobium sp.]
MDEYSRCDAVTGLEIIIAVSFICILTLICGILVFSPDIQDLNSSTSLHGGFVGFAEGETADILIVDGVCYGVQNKGGVILGVELSAKESIDSGMGSCTIPIRLISYQQTSINMADIKVIFSNNGITEKLSYSDQRPLKCPSWTIAQKSNLIPLACADSDIILEANEIFTILVFPETSVPAREKFTAAIAPGSYNPLSITAAVPPEINSQRIVELYV